FSGLFLFYFTGTLAAILVGVRVVGALKGRAIEVVAAVALGAAGILAAIPLFVHAPAALSFPLECAFAVAVLLAVISGFGPNRDIGAQFGLVALGIPLLVHTAGVIGAKFIWPEGAFDGPGVTVT